jgi:lipase chaperone LimK
MKPRFAIIPLLALAAMGAVVYLQYSGDIPVVSPDRQSAASASAASPDISDSAIQVSEAKYEAYAVSLRERYQDRIHDPVWQVKLIDHLIGLMKEVDPDNWRNRVEEILRLAFPDLIDVLLDRLSAMISYEEWLANTLPFMSFESPEARYQALWATRLALFGEDANLIWASELTDRQFRQQLALLDDAGVPVADKATQYIDLLRQTYGDIVFGNQGYNTTQMIGEFLQMGSVQDELHNAEPDQQREVLRAFRQQMGLDEEALARWEQLDSHRHAHRQTGDLYMTERQRLTATLSGSELTEAIQELQLDLFGEEEARFIRNEEASGVFRFQDRQIIGVN